MDGLHTTAQVAAELRITPGRVRQLAQARGLGIAVSSRLRLYTDADVDAMRVRVNGRPPGPTKREESPR